MMSAEIQEGNEIKIRRDGVFYEGRVMPSSRDFLIIKLRNGYNVGLRIDDSLEILEKRSREKRSKKRAKRRNSGGDTVSILGTGGTIASYVDYSTGAVHPAKSTSDLLSYIPEIEDVANVRARILFSVLSEDLKPKHWKLLAQEVKNELDGGCKGVVITHGTDTMSYTASALAFMLRELSGPVVLTGAQRSTDRPSSDGFLNLLFSTRAALSDLGEVVLAMHDSPTDDRVVLHRACRTRKMHSSARGAFKSIDAHEVGYVTPKEVYLGPHRRRGGKTVLDDKFDDRVGLIHSYPGLESDAFESFLERLNGLVISGTGLGHCGTSILDSIRGAVDEGKPIVMTSQCIYGTVDLNVYSRGRELLTAGAIPVDMLPETAMVKLGWVLGHTRDMSGIKNMMLKDMAGEFIERRFANG